jgi:ATP/maltotriose-dependent transcriptional regulator MalT
LILRPAAGGRAAFSPLNGPADGTFLDLGEPLQKLLQRIEKAGTAKGYAHQLLETFGESPDPPEPYGGLSEREYEALQLVAAGMSNQEIAGTLIVAVSTMHSN